MMRGWDKLRHSALAIKNGDAREVRIAVLIPMAPQGGGRRTISSKASPWEEVGFPL